MRQFSIQDGGEPYRAVIRQGLATIYDSSGKLARVHRIDGGKLPPCPSDTLMQLVFTAIRSTDGGPEYLDACACVRAARESALANPALKWRDYEAVWLAARHVREAWETDQIKTLAVSPREREIEPAPTTPSLPRSNRRRRLVAWGQR